jgi:hypothetical protein
MGTAYLRPTPPLGAVFARRSFLGLCCSRRCPRPRRFKLPRLVAASAPSSSSRCGRGPGGARGAVLARGPRDIGQGGDRASSCAGNRRAVSRGTGGGPFDIDQRDFGRDPPESRSSWTAAVTRLDAVVLTASPPRPRPRPPLRRARRSCRSAPSGWSRGEDESGFFHGSRGRPAARRGVPVAVPLSAATRNASCGQMPAWRVLQSRAVRASETGRGPSTQSSSSCSSNGTGRRALLTGGHGRGHGRDALLQMRGGSAQRAFLKIGHHGQAVGSDDALRSWTRSRSRSCAPSLVAAGRTASATRAPATLKDPRRGPVCPFFRTAPRIPGTSRCRPSPRGDAASQAGARVSAPAARPTASRRDSARGWGRGRARRAQVGARGPPPARIRRAGRSSRRTPSRSNSRLRHRQRRKPHGPRERGWRECAVSPDRCLRPPPRLFFRGPPGGAARTRGVRSTTSSPARGRLLPIVCGGQLAFLTSRRLHLRGLPPGAATAPDPPGSAPRAWGKRNPAAAGPLFWLL